MYVLRRQPIFQLSDHVKHQVEKLAFVKQLILRVLDQDSILLLQGVPNKVG